MPRIAVLDADNSFREGLAGLLRQAGHETSAYPTPGRFLDALPKGLPDLLILAMSLPGMNGKDVIRVLRGNPQTKGLPIIAVSDSGTKTQEVVEGLDLGADEYLIKPLEAGLLVARIAALLRRSPGAAHQDPALRAGELTVFPDQRSVKMKEKDVTLTHLEFDLLVCFLRQANRVLTRGLLLEAVWGGSSSMTTRTVDKHVESLRKKLHPFGKHIRTIIKVGYVLNFP